MYDRVAATEVASLVLLFAVAVIGFERAARGRSRFSQQGGARGIEPVQLTGRRAWAATAVCAAVVGLGFAGPVLQLCAWAVTAATRDDGYSVGPSYAGYLVNSVLIAGVAAVVCAAIAVLLASATRLGEGGTGARRLARLTTVGYAVPGPVVAIGVLAILAAADSALDALGSSLGGLLVTGTVAGLVYAYVVRFLALAYNSVDASLDKVSPSLTSAALTLGSMPSGVVRRVHLPLMRSGVGVALVLVAVEALKELPIVLMLRPFGFETLAIWVYQLASESRWELAALPALTIVVVAVLPVTLLVRTTLSAPKTGGWR
jgi:iron(III) transport system permease protein